MKNYEHLNEEDKNLLLEHDYDGIQELNHPLPGWWKASFVLTFIFALPYAIYYLALGGPTLAQEQIEDMKVINKVRTAYAVKMAKFDSVAYAKWDNAEGLKLGAAVYDDNCMACHEEGGKGDIGPNMTDAYWIHAKGTASTIYEVVLNGRDDNGMPAWNEDLSKDEILQVIHYLMSIKDKNIAGGKLPQGNKIN